MILPDTLTVKDLREIEKANPQMPQFVHRLTCHTYDQFVDTLYVEMDSIFASLVKDANTLQGDGHTENSLNADICRQLNRAGYSAHFDKNNRGHSDVTVEYGRFSWIGEGKKVKSVNNTHLRGGYDQLLDRYVTGMAGADRAGILIYCYAPDAKHVLTKWREDLEQKDQANAGYAGNIAPWVGNEDFAFSCTSQHKASGATLKIKHIVAPFYWSPPKSP